MKIVFSFFFLLTSVAFSQNQCSEFEATDYAFVIKGAEALQGSTISNVVVYRYFKRAWEKVEFQIDEVNQRGDYVLEGGMPFTARTDDGVYDDNDELVLSTKSFGDDFSTALIPEKIKKDTEQIIKIQVKGFGGCTRFALIVVQKSPAPKLDFTALFKPLEQIVESNYYQYQFNRLTPMLMGKVFIKSRGALVPVFKSSKFSMPIRTSKWWLPNMTFDDEDFKSEIESWRSGPIRSIVAVGSKYQRFFNLINLHLFSELVFYRKMFQIPTKVEFIFDTSDYLAAGSGLGYSIEFPQGTNWQIKTNLVDLPVKPAKDIRQKASEVKKFGRADFYAFGRSEKGGPAFWLGVRVDPKAQSMVPPPFLIRKEFFQDTEHKEAWPWLPKNSADLGVYLDIAGIQKGIYDFGLDLYMSDEAIVSNDASMDHLMEKTLEITSEPQFNLNKL